MSTTLTTTSLAANSKPLDPCEEFAQHGVYQSNACRTNLIAGTNCFPHSLVTLIMQHLPPIAPTTRNWETEWTGDSLGRDVVWFTLNNACSGLADEELVTDHEVTGKSQNHQITLRRDRSCLDVINDYLEKGNKFGAKRIERAYGRVKDFRSGELTDLSFADYVAYSTLPKAYSDFDEEARSTYHQVTGKSEIHYFYHSRDKTCLAVIRSYLEEENGRFSAEQIGKAYGRDRIFQYCPNYNPDYQLPIEIDDLMQTPLVDKFAHPEALDGMPAHVTRYTHLFGLYLKPAGMTASISEELISPCGTQFTGNSWQSAIADDDNTPTKKTEWRWFGEFALGRRGESWEDQLALIPPGLEAPLLSDTFCAFTHFACTRSFLPQKRWTRTSKVFGEFRVRLAFGGADADGLKVYDDDDGRVSRAVVPCGTS